MLKRKYKWYPHVILTNTQYCNIHRKLYNLYEKYRKVLISRGPGAPRAISSMWIVDNYIMLHSSKLHLLPYSMCEWIQKTHNILHVSQIVYKHCTLFVVEYQEDCTGRG